MTLMDDTNGKLSDNWPIYDVTSLAINLMLILSHSRITQITQNKGTDFAIQNWNIH